MEKNSCFTHPHQLFSYHADMKNKETRHSNWKLKKPDSLELQLRLLRTFVGHLLRHHFKVMGDLKVVAEAGVADEFVVPQQRAAVRNFDSGDAAVFR